VGAWIETGMSRSRLRQNRVAPCVGAWIETGMSRSRLRQNRVATCVRAWIEALLRLPGLPSAVSRPRPGGGNQDSDRVVLMAAWARMPEAGTCRAPPSTALRLRLRSAQDAQAPLEPVSLPAAGSVVYVRAARSCRGRRAGSPAPRSSAACRWRR